MVAQAVWAPSVHNTQPWWFSAHGQEISLYADADRQLTVADPSGREMMISCGASLFTARLALRSLGYIPETRILPDPAQPLLVARVSWRQRAALTEYERRLFSQVRTRRTHRGGFDPMPLSEDLLAALGEPDLLTVLRAAAQRDAAMLHIIADEGSRSALAAAVETAEGAQRLDSAYVRELASWAPPPGSRQCDGVPPTAYPTRAERTEPYFPSQDFARGHGWGLPPLSSASPRAAGVVCLLTTTTDQPTDWVNAGQALQRILLTSAASGVAAALHSQPFELAWMREFIRTQLTGGAYPQLLLRFGKVIQVAVTVRRPPESVLFASSAEHRRFSEDTDRDPRTIAQGATESTITYQPTGKLSQLTQAVEILRAAVKATPAGHPERARHLSDLKGALRALREAARAEENQVGREAAIAASGHNTAPSAIGSTSIGDSYRQGSAGWAVGSSRPPRDGAADSADDSPDRPRYLKARYPERIPVGKRFSLLASIVVADIRGTTLEPFSVPVEGRNVFLVVYAPGLRLLGPERMTVRVRADGNSEPVMFELRADTPGPRPVSITAWVDGSYLGELSVQIMVERDRSPGPHVEALAEITTDPAMGAVSLIVRYDRFQNAYRFEFRDEDNPEEVTSKLAYEPGPRVEQLVAGLDELAKGRRGYSVDQTRDYLINSGADLWRELVPEQLRKQFWERQERVRQLTILADKDAVPWELLYPKDRGHDAGFLVEQFPVTRALFNRQPTRRLSLWPACFVLPEGSLPEAQKEIEAMRQLLDPRQPPSAVISTLGPLLELIHNGNFGLLHFACHNLYNPTEGSSITLDKLQFTPMQMTTAVIDQMLDRSKPTVFINACRSASLTATYNRLDGWATKFLEAGAAAFIGSLWAVSDETAREFARELYRKLLAGGSLGEAVMSARRTAASQPGDPTWLAYTVYGDPRARISQRP